MPASVWKGLIAFGLVTIPVRLYRAARAERVKLREVYRPSAAQAEPAESESADLAPDLSVDDEAPRSRGSAPSPPAPSLPIAKRVEPAPQDNEPAFEPVRHVAAASSNERVIAPAQVAKAFEVAPEQFVEIPAVDLKQIALPTSPDMNILEFVRISEIDPIYFETSYYVQPEPAGEKAYALLFSSMRETGLVALAQFAMHKREHVVVLRPGARGLIAHTMFYASEVKAQDEYAVDPTVVQPKELALANALVKGLTTTFDPAKFRDTYRERLEALIASKVQSRPEAPAVPMRRPAKVADITEALKASLARIRKPPVAEQPPRKARKAR